MNRCKLPLLVVALIAGWASALLAADITGTWRASFDTQIGRQDYTYTLAVKDSKVTGKAKSANGESDLQDGKVEGDTVTFLEVLTYQGMEIRIQYTGKIVSDGEIKFRRQVGDFATEELVAKRVN